MSHNGGRKCSGMTVTVSGTKGAYRQVSTPTLKSVMEQRKRL